MYLSLGMNYLAHAYLSFRKPEILLGNMISDYVKGKSKFDYSEGIQRGIAIHRAIDEFTDNHPATREAKEFFRPVYRLYSGAFIDVVYDYFLAKDNLEFPADTLVNFSAEVYAVLQDNIAALPEKFQQLFPYMKKYDWLSNYQHTWGIERSFQGLTRRARYIDESDSAFAIFLQHYQALEKCYNAFLPEVKQFAQKLTQDNNIE
jgi:acyl carrier protein phosphodiesterase